MSVVCQFHQHGHCKFGKSCDKFHTAETCDSFPCPGIQKCASILPCRFAAKCSYLHYSLSNIGHHTAGREVQEVQQTMAELREEVVALSLEVDRLGSENRHLLETLEGLERDMRDEVDSKEELDDEPEPSVEEYCDELGQERHIPEQRCASILDGITAILQADKYGEAAGKIRESGCLKKIEQLRNHSDERISNSARGIMMRFEVLQLYPAMPRGTSTVSTSTRGGRSKPRKR